MLSDAPPRGLPGAIIAEVTKYSEDSKAVGEFVSLAMTIFSMTIFSSTTDSVSDAITSRVCLAIEI